MKLRYQIIIVIAFFVAPIVAMMVSDSLAVSGKTSAARGNPPATPASVKPSIPGAPSFIVGVWYQPRSSWPTWRDRGINTLVGIELEGATRTEAAKSAWVKAAHDFGFYVIGDSADADIILNGPDEPDGVGNVSPADFIASYGRLKAAAPTKLVFGNFDGEKSRWRPEADYVRYVQGCDVVGLDRYITNSGLQDLGGWDIYTAAVDKFVRIAAGKPVLVAIECSDQDLRVSSYLHDPANQPQGEQLAAAMRCPTADEVEREATIAAAHGARGIFYFPDKIGAGWEAFDSTPLDVATRMRAVNLKLTGGTPAPAPTPPAAALPDVLTINGRIYKVQ